MLSHVAGVGVGCGLATEGSAGALSPAEPGDLGGPPCRRLSSHATPCPRRRQGIRKFSGFGGVRSPLNGILPMGGETETQLAWMPMEGKPANKTTRSRREPASIDPLVRDFTP